MRCFFNLQEIDSAYFCDIQNNYMKVIFVSLRMKRESKSGQIVLNQKLRVIYNRADAKDFVCKNAVKDPYEFTADLLMANNFIGTTNKLLKLFGGEQIVYKRTEMYKM